MASIFNVLNEDDESQDLQSGSIKSIFGRIGSEETLEPKGSPTFTDYFADIVFQAPAKGVGTAVKGIAQLVAAGVDVGFGTDWGVEDFFKEGFFKIPETQTGIGDHF